MARQLVLSPWTITTTLTMPKEIVAVTLSRHTSSLPWGFTLSGGKDQGLTLKVGCVLDESIAERSGLRARDFIWTIGDKEVFDETHAGCVKLVKSAGDRLVLSVERGDHIVPSFEEIHRAKNGTNEQSKSETENRHRTGKAYFRDAMKGHGLPGKIPTSFTTCGKPYVENLQYNSPLEIYNEDTVDEMVKVMDTHTKQSAPSVVSSFKMPKQPSGSFVSSMGWMVNSSRPGKEEDKVMAENMDMVEKMEGNGNWNGI